MCVTGDWETKQLSSTLMVIGLTYIDMGIDSEETTHWEMKLPADPESKRRDMETEKFITCI